MSSLRETLPGTWRLVSRIDRTPAGEQVAEPSLGADPVALLIYDRHGNFAAQFMKRDRAGSPAAAAAAAPNNSRAQNGYDAYFGTYSVDETSGTVTQCLVGALSAENVGLVVTRQVRVVGDTLSIHLDTSSGGRLVVRTLTWQRAR